MLTPRCLSCILGCTLKWVIGTPAIPGVDQIARSVPRDERMDPFRSQLGLIEFSLEQIMHVAPSTGKAFHPWR